MLLQAAASVSSKSNSLESMDQWLKQQIVPLLGRLVIATFLMPGLLALLPTSIPHFPMWSIYGLAGSTVDSWFSPLLFLVANKLGIKAAAVDNPQLSPPVVPSATDGKGNQKTDT